MESPEPWLVCAQEFTCPRDELLQTLHHWPQAPWQVRQEQPPSRERFREAFEQVQAGFAQGRWDKVVPYGVSELRVEIGAAEIATALARLLSLPPPLMPYGFWNREGGLLGATPERLVEKQGRQVRSVAMAGTRRRGSSQAPLLDDPKQLAEHQAVVDDLRQELGRLGEVEVGPRERVQLPYLEHLQTRLQATLTQALTFEQLVGRLHPTPALGASPRGAADALLRDLDRDLPRHRFGAPFAWRTPQDDGRSVVAIRNVQWQGDRACIATGCGVVAASRFEDEWNELQAKQHAIRRLLGIARMAHQRP